MKSLLILFSGLLMFACNPYYMKHVNPIDVLVTDQFNETIKIESVGNGKLIRNNIYITLPDSLFNNILEGTFSYQILLNFEHEITDITLQNATVIDLSNNPYINYNRFDTFSRFIKKPDPLTKRYDSFFINQINEFKFKKIGNPTESNFVYCNFIITN